MADSTFAVLDAAGATVTFRSQDVVGTTKIMMSVPSNLAGTALIGQGTMASSIPVAIASNQSNVPFNLVTFGGTALTIGQQVMTASIPVVLPSNMLVSTNLTQVGGSSFSLGQKVSGTSVPVTIASDQFNINGATTTANSAPVALPTDQIVSTSLTQVGGVAFSLGQKVMATSIPVAISSNQSIVPVGGNVASGAANAGSPVKLGAVAHTAAPTAVADSQIVDLITDKVGKLIAVDSIRDLKATQTASVATAAEFVIVNALNATTFADIYGLVLANTGATTSRVDIRYGIASAIVMVFEVPSTDTRGFMLSAGAAIPGSIASANFSWTAQCAATTTLSVTSFYVKNI